MKYFSAVCLLAVFLVCIPIESRGNIINGDFSKGLSNWEIVGDVTKDVDVGTPDYAVVSDDSSYYSLLYQGVLLETGNYTLEFDFNAYLSDEYVSDSFLDYFAASIYFIDDISLFDLDTSSFGDGLPLIDLYFGYFDYNDGQISTSSKEAWLHYSIPFSNSYNYVIPTFELFGDTKGDSYISIDNVTISVAAVPEPSSLLLLGCGILCLGFIPKRKFQKE